jgi:hypothetical protein
VTQGSRDAASAAAAEGFVEVTIGQAASGVLGQTLSG